MGRVEEFNKALNKLQAGKTETRNVADRKTAFAEAIGKKKEETIKRFLPSALDAARNNVTSTWFKGSDEVGGLERTEYHNNQQRANDRARNRERAEEQKQWYEKYSNFDVDTATAAQRAAAAGQKNLQDEIYQLNQQADLYFSQNMEDERAEALKRLEYLDGLYNQGSVSMQQLRQDIATAKQIQKQEEYAKKQYDAQYGKGNIDLFNRPQYKYDDGSIATVESMSFNVNGKEVLIPTIAVDEAGNAVRLTDEQAIQRFYDTGEYLGIFDTVAEANAYAEKLHLSQEALLGSAASWSREEIDKKISELDEKISILTASNMNEEADALKLELDKLYKMQSMSQYGKDDEKTTYSHMAFQDEATGGSEAQEYLDFMQETMNYRKGMEQVRDIRSIDNDILRSLAIGAHSVGAGVANAGAGYNQLLSKDPVPTTAMQFASEELMKDLGVVGQTLYSAGTTVGNMLPTILLSIGLGVAGVPGAVAGGAASAAMGASVAGSTYTQAVKEGYEPEKAKTYAALVGAAEGVLQYLLGGIGKLGGITDDVILAKVKTIDNALARMALTGTVKIGSEIGEEELQLYLEPAIKSIVFNESYSAPKIEEIIETAVVTALSTGALEALSNIGARRDNSKVRSAAAALLTGKKKPAEVSKAAEVTNEPENRTGADASKAPETAQETPKAQAENVTAPEVKPAPAQAQAATAAETAQPEAVRSAQAQAAMNRAAQAFGETGQKAFATMNDNSMDPLELYAGFAVYHHAGMTGGDINSITSQYAKNFPENYRQIAYDAGVADAAASVKARTEAVATATVYGKDAGVIANDYSKRMNQDVVRQLDGVAKSIGLKVIVEDLGDSNGYLDSNGVIHIDIHAENPYMVVAAHEVTHAMEDMAPAEHKRYRDYVLNKLAEANGGSILELVEAQKEAYAGKRTLSDEQAMNELVADYTKRMMQDRDLFAEFAKKDQKAAHTLLDAIKKFLQKVRAVFKGNRQAQNAAAQREFGMDITMVEEAAKLWQEALTATQEASKSTKADSSADVSGVNKDGIVMNADGSPVAAVYDNGSTRLSLKTYKEGGRSFYEEYLEKQVKNKNLTAAEAADMLQQLDAIYDICNEYRNKYAPFSAWSDAAVQVDQKGNPVFSVVKKNGEYPMNLDFSLVCKKRRTLDGVFNLMVKNGMIDKIAMGEADIVKINDIIRSHGFETACALCFVDAKRFRQANVALQFADVYNEMVKSMIPEGSDLKVGYHNFGGNTYLPNVTGGIDTMADSALDMTHINDVLAGAPKKKANWTVEHKVADYLKRNPADRKLVDVGDFMSTAGFEQAQKTKPGIMGLYNAKKGSGGPKAAFGDVQYLNDILKRSATFNVKKAYGVGGVRVQSFSDYVPRMVFDYVQMFSELAAKKLPAHAYTKEPLFAMQYGMTGIKINMSLIPKVVDGGIAPGLDAYGNYVWADESFPYDVAVQIQDAKGYSANCGTICVGVSDEHIRTLMADDSIRMVIPYHKSGLNHIVASMNKIDQFEDYTNVQNTRYADSGTKLSKADAKKETGYNERLRELGDPRKAAEAYVRWCEENNYLPKFDKFAYMQIDGEYVVDDEGKRVVDENYYKLLEDFTGYDNGTYAPQGAVTMTFPKEGDAFGSMADLIAQGLKEDAILEADRTEKLPKILDEIATAFGIAGEDGVRRSVKGGSVIDEAVALVDEKDSVGNQLSKGQQEFFKDSKVRDKKGNLMVVYHGTNQGDFTEFLWDKTQRADGGFYGRGHYFTSSKGMADLYGSRVMQGYLNITNPFVWKEEINNYNGRTVSNVQARNIAVRINMARVFPQLFANKTIEYGAYNNRTGEMEEKSVRWGDLEKEVTTTMGTLKPLVFADGSVQWAYPGRFWDEQVGDRYASMEEAESHKFEAAAQAFVETHTGLANGMTFDDQTSFTQDYATEISDALMSMGYDGAMQDREGTEIVAFNSNQFKNADNTNPTSDSDIRYSRKGGSVVDTAAARAEDVEALKRQLTHWKSQVKLTKGFKVDAKDVEKLAKKLVHTYKVDTDTNALAKKLQELYDGIATGYYGNKEIDFETAKARSEEIARTIVENAVETENEMYVEYAELRKYLRSVTLNISAEDSKDIPDFNDFRNRNMGRMRIGTNGTNIDTVYQELSDLWPEFFNEQQETTPSDQLLQIAEVMEAVYRTQDVNPFGRYAEEAVSDIADEVLTNFFTLPQAQTFADKAAAKLKQSTADARLAGQMSQGRQDAKQLRKANDQIERLKVQLKQAKADAGKLQKANSQVEELKAQLKRAKADAQLAGQMAQGRKDAPELRKANEKVALLETKLKQASKDAQKLQQANEKITALEAKLKQETADAKLAGQMAQGRRDAALLRSTEERAARAQERAKAALAQEKQRGAAAVKNLKDKNAAKTAKTREQRKAAELRGKIIRHSRDMSQKLLRPTDKKHVPEELQSAVAAVLKAINLESNYEVEFGTDAKFHRVKPGDSPYSEATNRTKAFQQLREAYKKLAGEVVIDPAVIAGDGDQAAAGPLLQAVLDMGDIRIADMNSAQLDTVWRVLKAVEQSVSKANKLFISAKYETISEMADRLETHSVFRKPKKAIKAPKFLGGSGNLTLDLEIPLTFFSQYGDVGEAIYQELRDAQDYQERLIDQLAEEVGEIVTPKQVQQLQKEVHTFGTEDGVELKLTTAHIMELYELSKRKQAEDHLLKGGIVQPEIESAKVDRGTDMIKLTANDLGEIISKLTPEQKQIADSLQKLLTTTLADAGNRASMQAYGYKKFTGTDYWPIKSAQEALHSKVEKNANNTRSIKNIGLAQQVVPHANTALNLNGIFQTFAGHATDMIDYASWLCPMEDANRLFNYKYKDAMGIPTGKTVKGLLDRVGGSGSQAYWSNLMEDIQNGIGGPGDSAIAGIAARITGNVKGASVGANIRVVAQQPTAIFRAATVLSPANLSKGLAKGVTKGNGWQKALEHSDIAKRKDRGGFEISNPMQMSEILYDDRTGLARFNEAMSWAAAKADAVTWGKIWNACEWQVHEQNKAMVPGSEAFYQKTAELFADVINQSQVVDGVLQRSQIMRSSNQISKQMTSFMGEPTMSLNMLMRAYDAMRYEQDATKRGKAMKQAARVAGALLVTDAVTALAQSLIDGLRDDDRDKTYWQRVMSAFTGVTGDEESGWDKAVGVVLSGNLVSTMNPIGRLPYAKDLLSLIQGYSVERMDISAFSDLIAAGTTFVDSLSGEGSKTWAYATKQLATAGSKVLGISASNILRDVWSIARSIAIETGNIALQYEMEKAIYKIGNEKNDNRYIDILYDAMNSDEKVYRAIYQDMIKNGMSVLKITKGIEKRMKEDQGVTSVTDLTSRYLTPDQKTEYDKAFASVTGTKVWKSATEEQRGKLENNLYDLTVGNDAGEDLREKIEGGKSVGVDEVDYVLYKLAQEVASKDGNNNTSQDEAEAAAKMLTDLSRAEQAWLWQSTNKGWKPESNPFK